METEASALFDPPALSDGSSRFKTPDLSHPQALVAYNIGVAQAMFEDALRIFREQYEIGLEHGRRAFR